MAKAISLYLSLTFIAVSYFEAKLNIVPRYDAGTLQQDLTVQHTYWKVFKPANYEAGMKAMRKHYNCVKGDCNAPNLLKY